MPIKIKEDGTFVLLETIIGRRRLSMDEEINPKMITPAAGRVFPAIRR